MFDMMNKHLKIFRKKEWTKEINEWRKLVMEKNLKWKVYKKKKEKQKISILNITLRADCRKTAACF